MANTENRNYPLPEAGNHLSQDVGVVRQALTAIDTDVHTLQQVANAQGSDLSRINEKLRRAKLNALVGENLLPL